MRCTAERPVCYLLGMRAIVIGDPQTTHQCFLRPLQAAGLLDGSGRLRADACLLSVGDHFDFKSSAGWTVTDIGQEGIAILEWLESHPPEQVGILMGNHDACRVMELYRITDDDFTAARLLGDKPDFKERFPDIPTPDIAQRDFSSFSTAQRAAVQGLLLSGRMVLAATGRTASGRSVLVTHAGVTKRELALLGIPDERSPEIIATALNAFLQSRLERVREDWLAGRPAPLDLSPVHLSGVSGTEGGGLLYHRPQAQLEGWSAEHARRFHPSWLPAGLLQVCGHTQHQKMPKLIGAVPEVPEGALRSLWFDGEIRYAAGLVEREDGLWMVDSGLNHADNPSLLELAALTL